MRMAHSAAPISTSDVAGSRSGAAIPKLATETAIILQSAKRARRHEHTEFENAATRFDWRCPKAVRLA
jgi:hypothetical protein